MAFIITRTFGRDLRYLQVDEWARTPPIWLVETEEATRYENVGAAQRACQNYSGDGVLETT